MVGQTPLIEKLRELGRNLWWTWQPNVISLFRELDPDTLAKGRPQPRRVPQAHLQRPTLEARRRDGARLADRLRLPTTGRVPQGHRLVGARSTPRRSARGRSPTSRPSSACTRACRFTRAASASWPATTSRAPATWASRSRDRPGLRARAISARASTLTAGRSRRTSTPTPTCCRSSRSYGRERPAAADRDRDPLRASSTRRSGGSRSAGRPCTCSTRPCPRTASPTAP